MLEILYILGIAVFLGVVLRALANGSKTHQLRLLQRMLKIIITLGTLVFIIHVALLLCGIDEPFAQRIFGFSHAGLLLIIDAAFIFDLCWAFISCSIYCNLINQCIILQEDHYFDSYLTEARVVALCLGVVLLANILRQNKCKKI